MFQHCPFNRLFFSMSKFLFTVQTSSASFAHRDGVGVRLEFIDSQLASQLVMPPFLYVVFQKLLRRIEDMENIELQNRALWSANNSGLPHIYYTHAPLRMKQAPKVRCYVLLWCHTKRQQFETCSMFATRESVELWERNSSHPLKGTGKRDQNSVLVVCFDRSQLGEGPADMYNFF